MDSEGGDGEAIIELRDRVDPMLQVVLGRSFELGFLGSMPIDEQIDHALGFVAILEKRCGGVPASVIDLGTGGGVPGLVLISCWPDSRVVLMDASARRTGFLQEVVEGWPLAVNAEVVRGRAEELGHQGGVRVFVPGTQWVDGHRGTSGHRTRGPVALRWSGDRGTRCGRDNPVGRPVWVSGATQDGDDRWTIPPTGRDSGQATTLLISPSAGIPMFHVKQFNPNRQSR
jgi:hypothetical protein